MGEDSVLQKLGRPDSHASLTCDDGGLHPNTEDTISGRLAAVARRAPDGLAIQDLHRRLTYAELASQVACIAGAAEAAFDPEQGPVAIFVPFDSRFHLALLGALQARRVALVLDPEHPGPRIRSIADHAGVGGVLTTRELAAQARALFAPALPVLEVEDAVVSGREARGGPSADDPAYILYTSGSTGRPKGVLHSHANVLNDVAITTQVCEITAVDSGCVFYPATMGTLRNSLWPLMNGAALHVLPARELGANRLVEEIRIRRPTVIQMVPTLFRRLASAAPDRQALESVRIVRLVGDRSDWNDVDLFRRAFRADARLEISVASTECPSSFVRWFVDETLERGARLPVGRLTPGLELSILGEDGAPAADGQAGEVVVSGRHLALGYWREPELTAAAFAPDASDPNRRTFSTGDMCLRRPDGLLEFVGRVDRLLKIRGHRIEPAEVEAALRGCTGAAEAAIVVRHTSDGRPRALAAYVELEPGIKGLLPRHLLAMLSQRLPAYMLPAFVRIRALPRLANFKLDRNALEALDQALLADMSDRMRNPLLDTVAGAFESVVGNGGATPEDNLLSLGGDSLQSVELVLELERRLGVGIPQRVFRDTRSIAELSAWIAKRIGENREERA